MKKLTLIILLFASVAMFGQKQSLTYHPMFNPGEHPFYHGVAAGDSRSDGFVIWTRITPDDSVNLVVGKWYVATGDGKVVKSGNALAFAEKDYTVKITVHGLKPWTQYQYWFTAMGHRSPVGHVKTTPASDQAIDELSFVVFTGSNYNAGYFNAYCDAAKQNVDYAIHTGDYIYEYKENDYGNNPHRGLMPKHEIVSLPDYRTRYSHYRLDTCLQKVHQAFGWYTIWDDHEVANDTWKEGAQNHQPDKEGNFFVRKTNALTAYYEWIPIRETPDTSIQRVVNFGKMATLIFVDTRQYARDYQKKDRNDTTKTMLGNDQLQWLFDQMLEAQKSGVRWIVVTEQLMMAPLVINGKVINSDGWDVYPAERRKILDFIYKHDLKNVVFIGGDFHTSWVNELYLNPLDFRSRRRDTMAAIEFVTPSVTSPAANWFVTQYGKLLGHTKRHSYIRYVDLHHKGYMVLHFYPDRIEADYYYVGTIKKPGSKARLHKRYVYRGL